MNEENEQSNTERADNNTENERNKAKSADNNTELPNECLNVNSDTSDYLSSSSEEPINVNENEKSNTGEVPPDTNNLYEQTQPGFFKIYQEALSQSPNEYSNREAYIRALREWVTVANLWQNASASYQFHIMANTIMPPSSNAERVSVAGNTVRTRPYITLNPNEGFEFVIPSLWKRIFAELIDFTLMFILKLICIFGYIELFGDSKWSDFIEIQKNIVIHNDELANANADLAQAIMILEAAYRFGVFLYEASWLYNARVQFGSATPGKSLLGLTVVTVTKVNSVFNDNRNKILAYPATNLGFWNAIGRSFIKNIVLTIMFPFCFTMFLFQHNRTMYDLLFNTVVVEYDPNPPKRNWP